MDKMYHDDCLVCFRCHEKLPNQYYLDNDKNPICG